MTDTKEKIKVSDVQKEYDNEDVGLITIKLLTEIRNLLKTK